MDIKEKAKLYAIEAHKGQVRKASPEKVMIIHPINVANILASYGFDDNVIAAGYLHDVVEDTDHTMEDIEKEFGSDIASLVTGDNEPDKSWSWEQRKKYTIETIKNLDLRHKAIVCADKISNLEDTLIDFGIKGKVDFSSFKRGFDDQKWYFTSIYRSLINNEDETHPMFKRLKEIIDCVFYEKNDDYIKSKIFKNNQDEFEKLKSLHYRKLELYKLKQFVETTPFVIEFTGTPRTGKTTLINNVNDFFKKAGFKVDTLEEFTTSNHYKQTIYPQIKDNPKKFINIEIPKYVLEQLNEAIKNNPDIIIIDRSLIDRLIWIDRLYNKNGISLEEYEEYKSIYIPIIKEKINLIVATYADELTALRRDYMNSLSLEERRFLNETNLSEYNLSLLQINHVAQKENINLQLFDTTNKTQRQISFEVADYILKNMRNNYLEKINDTKELIKKKSLF